MKELTLEEVQTWLNLRCGMEKDWDDDCPTGRLTRSRDIVALQTLKLLLTLHRRFDLLEKKQVCSTCSGTGTVTEIKSLEGTACNAITRLCSGCRGTGFIQPT